MARFRQDGGSVIVSRAPEKKRYFGIKGREDPFGQFGQKVIYFGDATHGLPQQLNGDAGMPTDAIIHTEFFS
ncbi:hypothetical protein [Pelagibacterium limicola]|uniref:hypothetical protein n=1 Tax=Pelagibacterium limicola TaxID=2791022 RepID=UPI001FE2E732|nr:hypothetical protein [Pelagibacterium limicola]